MNIVLMMPDGLTAEVDPDGFWECEDSATRAYLNLRFSRREFPSGPSSGPFASGDAAREAAKVLRAVIEWPSIPAQLTDVVY